MNNIELLIQKAFEAQDNCYTPYSYFKLLGPNPNGNISSNVYSI